MNYYIRCQKQPTHRLSRHLHSTFFEFFGRVIYDGIWVGKDSPIENVDGIRKDVIDGCRELGLGAMRWPGGCCADHYHWKNGVGAERPVRIHPLADPANPVWRHEFGTDEFLRFCELTGADPILTVNTATGSPEEFLDWYEYVNGSSDTYYGALRAQNGHPAPYNVRYWGIGNTDENVWHNDYNIPVAYAQTYLRYQTVVRRERRKHLYFIGLGLSMRHNLPGWTGKMLDHVTRNQRDLPPDALSVHHYLGGAKQGGALCGNATEYTDEGYYALLDLLWRYQYDIDLHRLTISEHAGKASDSEGRRLPPRSKIAFDEWGVWHPEATVETDQNQPQTLRDALFAALSLHIFYRNSDIVEFAMETQLSNLLQSLFETDGEKFFKTPTFYVFKLLRPHLEQYLIPALADDTDPDLDTVATLSEDETQMTVSIVNRHLYEDRTVHLHLPDGWRVARADILTCENVRDSNSFEHPDVICDAPFTASSLSDLSIPRHSLVRLCLTR